MEQGNKGMEFFWGGWLVALSTNYLVGLDTGTWIPLLVSTAQFASLIMMFIGIGKFADQNPKFKKAGRITGLAALASLGLGALQALSLDGMSPWISITAIVLALTGCGLFLALTGLVLLGMMEQHRNDMDEKTGYGLRYRWILFLTFGILSILVQSSAVLLTNENFPALAYLAPAAGVPALIAGVAVAMGFYGVASAETKSQSQ